MKSEESRIIKILSANRNKLMTDRQLASLILSEVGSHGTERETKLAEELVELKKSVINVLNHTKPIVGNGYYSVFGIITKKSLEKALDIL